MVDETHKILGDDSIRVQPTCVRVPVFYGHSESVHLETEQPMVLEDVRHLLANAPGVKLSQDLPCPVELTGSDEVHVGRLRLALHSDHGLNIWLVADNLRKGAALNAVQIAEILVRDHL